MAKSPALVPILLLVGVTEGVGQTPLMTFANSGYARTVVSKLRRELKAFNDRYVADAEAQRRVVEKMRAKAAPITLRIDYDWLALVKLPHDPQ